MMAPFRRRDQEDSVDISVTGPGGIGGSIKRLRNYDLLVVFAFVALLLSTYVQYKNQEILRQVVLSNNMQTLATAKLTCVIVLPIEQRPVEMGMNSYCEAMAKEAFRQMQINSAVP